MNDKAVISCPRCVRQFEVDAATDSVVAQCGVCKAHFVIVIPRLTGPTEDALVLDQEIEPHINFFKEGCEEMTRNVCELLRLVGGPITPENILMVVKSLPMEAKEIASDSWQDGPLNCLLKATHMRSLGVPERRNHLMNYFLGYIPGRSHYALDMLKAAMTGVLGGIDWPSPVDVAATVDRPDASGVPTTPLPPRLKRFSWLRGQC